MRPMKCALSALLVLSSPAFAQNYELATAADGAILRGLDRMNGQLVDLALSNGASGRLGPLNVMLEECRYPTGNPSGDAYASLKITEDGDALFAGWMLASSPALNAMDHRRYDVWVLRCTTS